MLHLRSLYRFGFASVLSLVPVAVSAADIELRVGDLTVVSSEMNAISCLQIPVFVRDPDAPRDLRDLTVTLELSGDTFHLVGGPMAEMFVGNAFTSGDLTGLTKPGTNLSPNNSGTGAPSCTRIFNQATEGLGPAVGFWGGAQNAHWFVNNNQGGVGRKSGFAVNLSAESIGTTVPGEEHLVAVVTLPYSPTPGASNISLSPVSNQVVTDANIFTWHDGNSLQVDDLDLSAGPGQVDTLATAPLRLRVGDLTVSEAAISTSSCLQVPIFVEELGSSARDLRDLTVTLELGGDTHLLSGGVTSDMFVGNAFTSGSLTGIANPPVTLSNNNSGTPAPTCPQILNQATEGLGPAVDFVAGAQNAHWFVNNNQGGVGRKTGFAVNLGGQSIATTVPGQELLVGVIVLPVQGSGEGQITVTPTSNAVVANANVYTWHDGNSSLIEEFDFAPGAGVVDIVVPDLELRVGSLTVREADLTSTACLQVPILLRDPGFSRDLVDLFATVEISGDTGVISGGITTEMFVGNGFTSGDLTGLADPGVNLTNNSSGAGAPSCPLVFNQATEGSGPAIDFEAGNQNGGWTIDNNLQGVGQKQGYVFNGSGLVTTPPDDWMLVGVVVVPVVASPGNARLLVRATTVAQVADGNSYQWYPLGGGGLELDYTEIRFGTGVIEIGDPVFADGFESGNLCAWGGTCP